VTLFLYSKPQIVPTVKYPNTEIDSEEEHGMMMTMMVQAVAR
jgi:hypothetical protein